MDRLRITAIGLGFVLAAGAACARPVRQDSDGPDGFVTQSAETPTFSEAALAWDGDPQGAPATLAITSREDLRIERAIASRDIVLGMTVEDVQKSWGDPAEVLFSGHPAYGNQRWIYVIGVSGDATVRSSRRVIDFENGHVAAWHSR